MLLRPFAFGGYCRDLGQKALTQVEVINEELHEVTR